jgi:GT2 family glycosyltransferase
MPTSNPSVSVVTVNWNLPEETARCVASILAGDYPRQQVVVVDNASTDDSVARLRARFGERITLLEAESNLYYGGGCNLGIAWSLAHGADCVLVLNNDTWIAPDMVTRLVRLAEAHPDAGIVAPMILCADEPRRIWALGSERHRWLPMPRDIGRGALDRGQFRVPRQVDYVTGCAMLIRREALAAGTPFDSRYTMYYEDADLCARVRARGLTIWVEPRAKMWHLGSASAALRSATSRYQRTRHRVLFYRQHPHGRWPLATHLAVLLSEVARGVRDMLRGHPHVAWAAWQGFRDGSRQRIHE